jgi:hypothetical protein
MAKQTFDAWMAKVDERLEALCMLSSADLSDCCYYDMYESGDSPSQAARQVLRENGF